MRKPVVTEFLWRATSFGSGIQHIVYAPQCA